MGDKQGERIEFLGFACSERNPIVATGREVAHNEDRRGVFGFEAPTRTGGQLPRYARPADDVS